MIKKAILYKSEKLYPNEWIRIYKIVFPHPVSLSRARDAYSRNSIF